MGASPPPPLPVHLPIAYSLCIFSSQTLTSKVPALWLGRQAAKLPVKSPAAEHPYSSSGTASPPERDLLGGRQNVGTERSGW